MREVKEIKRLVHSSEMAESRCCTANCAVTPSLIKEIDTLKDELQYPSRSEFIYQAILNFIESHQNINIREYPQLSESIRKE